MSDDVFDRTNTSIPDTETAPTTPEWTPMKTAQDLAPKPEEYGNDADGIRQAARDLEKARTAGTVPQAEAEAEPTLREYRTQGGVGDPVPMNETVSAQQASEDVTKIRNQEWENAQQPLGPAVDAVREAYANIQQPQQPQQQTAEARQPQLEQPQQQQPDIDPEIRAALENPKIREALSKEVSAAENARAQYAQATLAASRVAASALLSDHPELAQLSDAEIPHALAAIAKVDPARAQAIDAKLSRAQASRLRPLNARSRHNNSSSTVANKAQPLNKPSKASQQKRNVRS